MDINNRLGFIWSQLALNAYAPFVEEEDLSTFTRRAVAEGAEFYARGLTRLSNDLLAGCESGQLVITSRFGPKNGSCLPRFMYKAWSSVFTDLGALRDDADIGAIACLRQLTAVFGKIEGGHTPESEKEVIRSFVAVEEHISSTFLNLNRLIGKTRVSGILEEARATLSRVFGGVNPREIRPKHSSGVSSDGSPLWRRYELPVWVEKIHTYWQLDEYYTAGAAHVADKWWCTLNLPEGNPRAKVLIVPKNALSPRLISCEPSVHMWIQQGLMSALTGRLERHPLSSRSVHFTDQSYNQRAARLGSLNWKQLGCTENWATIDLKDASDLIRLDLVQYLFPREWAEALTRARSDETVLPNGRVIAMKKHAPMGSATCFPVMASVIWAILRATLRPGTPLLVYGDDIALPAAQVERAMEALEAFGLRVNRGKSFYKGPFRESCGKEYFKGKDVTPVRLRCMPEGNLDNRDKMIAFTNNLWVKFGFHFEELIAAMEREWGVIPRLAYDRTTVTVDDKKWIREDPVSYMHPSWGLQVTKSEIAPLPGVLLDYVTDTRGLPTKWNHRLQRREFQYVVGRPRREKYPIDDWSQLFRALVNPRDEQPLGVDLLKEVSYNKRWIPL